MKKSSASLNEFLKCWIEIWSGECYEILWYVDRGYAHWSRAKTFRIGRPPCIIIFLDVHNTVLIQLTILESFTCLCDDTHKINQLWTTKCQLTRNCVNESMHCTLFLGYELVLLYARLQYITERSHIYKCQFVVHAYKGIFGTLYY